MTAPSTSSEADLPHKPHRPSLLRGATKPADDPVASAAASLAAHLLAPVASIPPKFFYDDLGSRLFAAITALDEYYPTRTEAELLQQHLPAIVAATPVAAPTFVDVGAGNCEKAGRLLGTVRPAAYVAVDISREFLGEALARLRREFPEIAMQAVATDFSERLELPPHVPAERRLFFYPGSSIGNFTPAEAVIFLGSLRRQMRHDGALWIGVDLRKPKAVLERAYDDELGVTAAFNRNVLRHVNRVLGADFALADWRHVAFYDEAEGRIEMHLEAVRDVAVTWPGAVRRFRRGERIHTENSYKYSIQGFLELLASGGLRGTGHWTDASGSFAFFVAVPARSS